MYTCECVGVDCWWLSTGESVFLFSFFFCFAPFLYIHVVVILFLFMTIFFPFDICLTCTCSKKSIYSSIYPSHKLPQTYFSSKLTWWHHLHAADHLNTLFVMLSSCSTLFPKNPHLGSHWLTFHGQLQKSGKLWPCERCSVVTRKFREEGQTP